MRFRSVLLVCGVAGLILAAESGNDLFQKGLAKERAEGDARGAIQIYQRVASMPGIERKLAAEALFRIAECQQAIGNAEARKTYQRIVKDFGDQRDVAVRAGDRLLALEPAASHNPTELSTRRVWVPPSSNMRGGSLSADGRFFSYADYFTTGDLAVRDLVTGETRHVTHQGSSPEYATGSVISPDQKKIAFAWYGKNRELRVIDWEGSNQKTLYSNSEGYAVPDGWSSDGREVLATISTGQARTRQLAWIPAAGGTPRILKTFPWEALGTVQVSSDGRYIAYDASGSDIQKRAIYVLSTDGATETALTDGAGTDEVFGWMPDGRTLLFATDRTGARELWALPLHEGKKAGEPFLVKPDLGRVDPIGIGKDGSLLYSRHNEAGQVYTASLDWNSGKLSDTVPLAKGVVAEGGADWSPNGKELAYVAHRGTEHQSNGRFIVIHSFETGRDREISPKQNLRINNGYSWSPDGKSYLVTGTDVKARYGAYAVDLEAGDVRTLVQREIWVDQPQWLPDGKHMLYVLTEGRGVFIRDLETETDREIKLDIPGLTRVNVAASPDGRQLAFSPQVANRYRTLYVMPLEGGVKRRVFDLTTGESMAINGWTPDSQRILLASAQQKGEKVEWSPFWISANGGDLHPIGTPGALIHFAAQGQRVAFTHREIGVEFWMLQNITAAMRTRR